jgi:hypothetical protein
LKKGEDAMAYSAGAAGAATAAIARAVKASGAIVGMETEDFLVIVNRCEKPLVVVAPGGLLDRSFRYLVGYKGLVFHTKSKNELMLPDKAEVVHARTIWIPG